MRTVKTFLALGLLAFAGLRAEAAPAGGSWQPRRIHIWSGLSLSSPNMSQELTRWGFGDDHRVDIFFGYITVHYPHIHTNKPRLDLRVEYSLTPRIALGLAVASLGNVDGRGYDLHGFYDGEDDMGNFLDVKARGTAYFLTASYIPPPTEARRFSPRFGLGVGMSDVKLAFETNVDSVSFDKNPFCGLAFAGLDFWPLTSLTVGVSLEYRYVAIRPRAFDITATYTDYWMGGNFTVTYPIESSSYSLGGLVVGITLGVHI
jgi:opacity protein-like surface antigen